MKICIILFIIRKGIRKMEEKQVLDIQSVTAKMKADSSKMAALSLEARNNILKNVKEALLQKKEEIFAANKMDMDAADENGVTAAVKKRLKFDEHKLLDVTQGIEELIKLDDPIGKTQFTRQLDEGLTLQRITCPIGVIGIIFEARPDALVQISSLCIKSGNCAVLKGGKETTNTNRVLFQTIYQTAVECGAPSGCMYQAELHSEIDELLACHKSVDLLIPRGSNKFVQYIMNNTKIPVMGHADGICHTYLDKDADDRLNVSELAYAVICCTAAYQIGKEERYLTLAKRFADRIIAKADPVTGNIPAEHYEAPSGPHLVDTIYTVNWCLLGIQNLVKAGGAAEYEELYGKLLNLFARIQDQDESRAFNGCWRGMFDMNTGTWGGGDRYEGGAGSIYSGWTNAPIAIAFANEALGISLVD